MFMRTKKIHVIKENHKWQTQTDKYQDTLHSQMTLWVLPCPGTLVLQWIQTTTLSTHKLMILNFTQFQIFMLHQRVQFWSAS